MWSIGNEVTNWSWKGLTPSNPRPLMEALNALAKREDPTRPTTIATCCEPLPGEDDDRPILTGIADTVGFNRYIGWYGKGHGIGRASCRERVCQYVKISVVCV